jgi:dUTP pyrophosphatase
MMLSIKEVSISSAYDYVLPARGRIIAQTDIQIAVPVGCYGRVG